jgi:glycosyltransferase involved in cell wall biosynthesis
MRDEKWGRVDLHLHSHASNVTDYYAANHFSIPESYSDPIALHRLLKARGMNLVTLTDHNSIDGVKEMLDRGLPDVFISAEMTTTFPEDGCNIHITVANMTEAQFAEIDRLRGNVYEMVAYCDREIARETRVLEAGNRIAYFMTHPLMSTQNRPYGREGSLSVAHLEKALLLCNCLEVQNGARTRALNDLTLEMLRRLDKETIERLANRHGLAPKGDTPWLKSVVGGSDDHSGINPGRTWTAFAVGESITPNSLIDAIRGRATNPGGDHGGPITIAHSVLKLLYEGGQRHKSGGGKKTRASAAARAMGLGGALQALLKQVFDAGNLTIAERVALRWHIARHRIHAARQQAALSRPFEAVLDYQIHAMLCDPVFREQLEAAADTDQRIFLVVKTLVNRLFVHYVRNLQQGSARNLIAAIKETVTLVCSNLFVSLPYLLAFTQHSADGKIARDVRRAFKVRARQRVVLLTDTFFEVNGVSNTIKRMIRESIRRDIDFTVIACVDADESKRPSQDAECRQWVEAGRLKLLPAIATLDFPRYDGLKIHFPPFLDLLRELQEGGYTKMQISTPGVVGAAGLIAAKLLQIETAATYHTSFPEYVENYTGDVSLEAMAWKYMLLFYHSVDETIVPSRFVADQLHDRGLRNRKLLVLDRWVDVERFHPGRRDAGFAGRHGIAADAVKFVYVGRLAIEKNLHLLADAFRLLVESGVPAHLVVIGGGPYRDKLASLLESLPASFTGTLHGEALAGALAACDVKVFPSTTDTWGNAPLEAQASGLPVIVTDIGGPAELMRDGETGLMVRGNDVRALFLAMRQLADAPTRQRMGAAARRFAEDNRVDQPFTAILDADAYRRRLRRLRRATGAGAAGAAPVVTEAVTA